MLLCSCSRFAQQMTQLHIGLSSSSTSPLACAISRRCTTISMLGLEAGSCAQQSCNERQQQRGKETDADVWVCRALHEPASRFLIWGGGLKNITDTAHLVQEENAWGRYSYICQMLTTSVNLPVTLKYTASTHILCLVKQHGETPSP